MSADTPTGGRTRRGRHLARITFTFVLAAAPLSAQTGSITYNDNGMVGYQHTVSDGVRLSVEMNSPMYNTNGRLWTYDALLADLFFTVEDALPVFQGWRDLNTTAPRRASFPDCGRRTTTLTFSICATW